MRSVKGGRDSLLIVRRAKGVGLGIGTARVRDWVQLMKELVLYVTVILLDERHVEYWHLGGWKAGGCVLRGRMWRMRTNR